MKSEEIAGIIVIVAIVVVLILGYNFMGKIKTAPINLVPSGTQQAVNPTSQQALNATTIGAAAGTQQALYNQYAYNQMLQAQQAQAYNMQAQAQLINAYGNLGQGIGDIVAGATNGGAYGSDYSGYDY